MSILLFGHQSSFDAESVKKAAEEQLSFSEACDLGASAFLVVGERSALSHPALLKVLPTCTTLAEDAIKPVVEKILDATAGYVQVNDKRYRVTVAALSDERGRNSGFVRSDLVPDLVSKHAPKEGNFQIVLVCKTFNQVTAMAAAVARAFPVYSKKTTKRSARVVYVDFIVEDQLDAKIAFAELQLVADAIRKCARLVDMPAAELHTDAYVAEAKKVAESLKNNHVSITVIQDELEKKGFGGLWGVGKAAVHKPALVVLSYTPPTSKKSTAWVGKGIVYDTGGLSIKGSANMPSMKCDMGGSAAILSAFEVAVKTGYEHTLHAVLCLAENSVDAHSTRPDDILTLYSGKTVEINNTDAEGRLVLGDGVAYASLHLSPNVILDMATLTGAQLICTGKKHAAILTNSTSFEAKCLEAGKKSGDWVFPILYAPEVLKKEFESQVADMKNSVKDRANAQSSCAGHFVEDHLSGEWKGEWCHVDIAGPAFVGDRGTGFGVSFLVHLLKEY